MKNIKLLFVIALIGTLFVMTSCELITNQNNQIEVPAIVSQVLSYDGQNLVSEGTADFADNGSYQELKKHLTNNKVISGFVLKTIEDNAPATGTLTKINTVPNGISFAFILDQSNTWIVNSDGKTIQHSTNGGKTFITQSNPTANTIYAFTFTNALNGWACGDSGTVLHTTNGGTTWIQQNSGIDLGLYGIQFLDNNNGWAVGNIGTILHTTNGGTTWIQLKSGVGMPLYEIEFVDKNNGWVIGDLGVRHTIDGGSTWVTQLVGTAKYKLKFTDSKNAWVVGANLIFHTTDGGTNWIRMNLPPDDNIGGYSHIFTDVQFVDANNGWLISATSLFRTTDGGNSWSWTDFQNGGLSYNEANSFNFFDQNSGEIVFNNNIIYYSRTPKFSFQFTIKDANNPSNVLLTRNMENISITDWYAHPYTIVLTRAERDIVSNYFKNTSKFIYDISLVDDKITPFSFKLNMQTYLVSGMKLSTN